MTFRTRWMAVGQLAVRAGHWRAHRAPIAELEPATRHLRPPDVVLLHRHHVRNLVAADPLQGRAHTRERVRVHVAGVFREDLENDTSENCSQVVMVSRRCASPTAAITPPGSSAT